MIKTLIRKELRENFKIAALGAVAFTLSVVWCWRAYSRVVESAVQNHASFSFSEVTQPLLSPIFLTQTAWLCAIFGALVGWMQIHNERNRDLWAFLIHRPITRSQIFFAKLVAGLALYFLAAGLPLAGFVLWDRAPGHVAAPFEWAMALPLLKLLFAGMPFYFAGILTGLRQARWYVSRAFGAGLALPVIFLAIENDDGSMQVFWLWLLLLLVCAGLLAVAAWGNFLTHGQYSGQPLSGRLALNAAMFVGVTLALGLGFAMLTNMVRPTVRFGSSFQYTMSKDGEIYAIKQHNNEWALTDLNGNPILSSKDGLPLGQQEFFAMEAAGVWTPVNFGERQTFHYPWDRLEEQYYAKLVTTPDILWFFWRKSGHLFGYNMRSRQRIANLGPDGYVADFSGNDARFALLHTATAIYKADLVKQTINQIFTTPIDEPLGGVVAFRQPNLSTNLLVVTRHSVKLLSDDGAELVETVYQPADQDDRWVRITALEPAGRFAVWFEAPPLWFYRIPGKRKAEAKLPTHVVWLAADGIITKAEDLPELPHDPPDAPWLGDTLSYLGAPLAATVLTDRGNKESSNEANVANGTLIQAAVAPLNTPSGQQQLREERWVLSLLGTIICVGIGWLLGRRYCVGRRAQLCWGLFIALFSVFGLLTLLCVQEWPAREVCPNCKKRRVVDRERCEHCGAEFAQPTANGTEIFEPLTASP